jgi:hypothetical protein
VWQLYSKWARCGCLRLECLAKLFVCMCVLYCLARNLPTGIHASQDVARFTVNGLLLHSRTSSICVCRAVRKEVKCHCSVGWSSVSMPRFCNPMVVTLAGRLPLSSGQHDFATPRAATLLASATCTHPPEGRCLRKGRVSASARGALRLSLFEPAPAAVCTCQGVQGARVAPALPSSSWFAGDVVERVQLLCMSCTTMFAADMAPMAGSGRLAVLHLTALLLHAMSACYHVCSRIVLCPQQECCLFGRFQCFT